MRVAKMGIDEIMSEKGPLRGAVNVHRGRLTNAAVADAFGLPVD
jgi:alanine dehydrogenase